MPLTLPLLPLLPLLVLLVLSLPLLLPRQYIWFAVYLNGTTSDAEPVFACFSDEPASMVHPAEATWICEERWSSCTGGLVLRLRSRCQSRKDGMLAERGVSFGGDCQRRL